MEIQKVAYIAVRVKYQVGHDVADSLDIIPWSDYGNDHHSVQIVKRHAKTKKRKEKKRKCWQRCCLCVPPLYCPYKRPIGGWLCTMILAFQRIWIFKHDYYLQILNVARIKFNMPSIHKKMNIFTIIFLFLEFFWYILKKILNHSYH